jgi:RsiW-degrading membrane proteinase PrsW (M82 family)
VVPFILLALEAVLAIIVFIGVMAYVSAQPELANQLQALSQQIMILGPQSEATRDLLLPLLTKPGVIVTALIYIAVLVPAIEELFKPLGVWLFASKLDSPAQGFALGALSGAGYALIETIGVSGQGAGWASLLLSRIGTGVLHITTSALMGAAIVRVWNDRRYLRLIGTYLLAVTLHGLWNTFALLFSFSNLAELLDEPGWLRNLQPSIVAVMSILAIGLFAILLISNRKLRGQDSPPSTEATPPADRMDETL